MFHPNVQFNTMKTSGPPKITACMRSCWVVYIRGFSCSPSVVNLVKGYLLEPFHDFVQAVYANA